MKTWRRFAKLTVLGMSLIRIYLRISCSTPVLPSLPYFLKALVLQTELMSASATNAARYQYMSLENNFILLFFVKEVINISYFLKVIIHCYKS
jgi:hypothetical protein